jgi:hypothetical protein
MALNPSRSLMHVRLLSIGGLFVTAGMMLLAVYPGLFTIIAIPVLPAPIAFGALIFRPELASKWPKMVIYLAACVAVSAASWLGEFIWLSSH